MLPFSKSDRPKIGKRVSDRPLHDTYIGSESKQHRDEFCEKSGGGALVAEIDEPGDKRKAPSLLADVTDPLPRVQRVFTMPLAHLLEQWKETAHRWQSQRTRRE